MAKKRRSSSSSVKKPKRKSPSYRSAYNDLGGARYDVEIKRHKLSDEVLANIRQESLVRDFRKQYKAETGKSLSRAQALKSKEFQSVQRDLGNMMSLLREQKEVYYDLSEEEKKVYKQAYQAQRKRATEALKKVGRLKKDYEGPYF